MVEYIKKEDLITNQSTIYEYDTFGRMTKEIQPNGITTFYSTNWDNSQANSLYKKTIQVSNINGMSIIYFDKYGHEIYNVTTGWKGRPLISSKEYNSTTGLLEKEVHPHYAGETEKYTTYNYGDFVHRLTSKTFFDGANSLTTTYYNAYHNNTSSVSFPNGQTKTTTTDASGLVIRVTDDGGTVEYSNFNALGQPLTITSNGAATTIAYDEMGNKWKLTDPNAGTIEYQYCADGQLRQQKSANGDLTDMVYDDAGRVKTKTITNVNGGTPAKNVTAYYYVPNNQNGAGQVDYIEQTFDNILSHKQDFSYDSHHQVNSVTEIYDNQTVTTSYSYDALWRLVTTTTPSGLVTTNVYDDYGDVYQVRAGNKIIWEGNDQNSSGQWLKYTLGNGLQTDISYTDRDEPKTIKTGMDINGSNNASIQNLFYGYDAPTGNLLIRKDILKNRNEIFTYDALDRLLTAQLAGNVSYSFGMTYTPNGNINTKSDVGTYQYNTPRPNALSGITGKQTGVSTDKQFITYTPFNKVSEIRQGIDENTITKKYNIYYGLDEQRIKSVYTENGVVQKTRYYFGAYEKDKDRFGNITQTDYIYTPAGLTAMLKGGTLYYIHTDNLGSIQAVTGESKNVISSYYYTPWGGRVLLSGVNITDRGYTFHEHLEPFGLINMNGRVYDPVLARFLSPDPYVQAPDYTQNFNRYSYCLNNPFKFTDPNGEWIHLVVGAIIGGIVNWAMNGAEFSWKGLGYFGIGAVAGALGAGVGAGISSALAGGSFGAGFIGSSTAATAGASFFTSAAISGGAGFSSGFTTGFGNGLLQGQNFGQAIWSGTKAGLITGASGALIGGVLGGIEAADAGANFWTGNAKLDIDKYYGCSDLKENYRKALDNLKKSGEKLTGKYVGEFEGVNVFETEKLGTFVDSKDLLSGGITLPGRGITVGQGVFSRSYDNQLMRHEFGHILQARKVGETKFYAEIATRSLWSAAKDDGGITWSHSQYWTETWANYLSANYFYNQYTTLGWDSFTWDTIRFPIKNISPKLWKALFGN